MPPDRRGSTTTFVTLHLVKLCVGTNSIEDLAAWQRENRHCKTHAGKACVYHPTYQFPKRRDDLLDGGSLYWVIKGQVQARQQLLDIKTFTDANGISRCELVLGPEVVETEFQPRRAFQGWRYLTEDDAPRDLKNMGEGAADLPLELRRELAELGLL